MSWGPRTRPANRQGPQRKQKNFLQTNKKFTGILLLVCLISMGVVYGFMWNLYQKECQVTCADPSVGCTVAPGFNAIAFQACHGFYNVKTNSTVSLPFVS